MQRTRCPYRVALALMLGSCASASTEAESNPPADAAPVVEAQRAPEDPVVPVAAENDVAAFAGIGIAECDEYLQKYRRCIDERMPDEARPRVNEALELTQSSWREVAEGSSEDVRTVMAEGCTLALEEARKATEAFGCEW